VAPIILSTAPGFWGAALPHPATPHQPQARCPVLCLAAVAPAGWRGALGGRQEPGKPNTRTSSFIGSC